MLAEIQKSKSIYLSMNVISATCHRSDVKEARAFCRTSQQHKNHLPKMMFKIM